MILSGCYQLLRTFRTPILGQRKKQSIQSPPFYFIDLCLESSHERGRPYQTLTHREMATNDAFDNLLNLEEDFYSEGYQQGVADGERAGRIEGRAFGIEKGFEKFIEAGRLHGKSIVWANRLPQPPRGAAAPPSAASVSPGDNKQQALPVLSGGGARLEKNIVTLHALVEPDTLSTENTDDAVNDFDDRVKRAQGKARVIERHVGEDTGLNAGAKDDGTVKAAAADGGQASSSTGPPSKEAVSF